ncbi:MAG: hypothetical protein L6R42_003188 [Xanthoria sp. 1 TBL-2021]|nr:MAG: hypothetical protein L6R42_003188 [Xanthoria sp. 1 TBL-2021]
MSEKGEYVLYRYSPSIVAAAVAIVVFAILTGLHTYRMIQTKLWFCVPFTIGGVFELIGYIGRAAGHSSPESLVPYIIQSLFVLVAPALFAASIYMTLGRLIRAVHAESLSIVRVSWLTKLFVCGDVFTFFIQGGGGGIMASHDPDKVKMGQNIILGGLFLQIIIFGLFVVASIIFHLRLRKQPTREAYAGDVKWQKMLLVLYAVSAIILVRNIFRVVEYIGGNDGPLLRVEWPIYVFDALLMAATMAIWFAGYPTLIRPAKTLSSDSESGMQLPETDIGMSTK